MANHAVFGAATQSGSRLSLLAPALLALVPLVPQPVLFSTPSAYTRAECSNPTWLAYVGTATCRVLLLTAAFWLRRWSLVLRFLDTVKAFLLYLVLPLNGKSCCVWCCHSIRITPVLACTCLACVGTVGTATCLVFDAVCIHAS